MITEYKRYIGHPAYTEIQLSTMTEGDLKSLYRNLKFQPIMVQIVKNFRDLRIKQLIREQITLIEKVLNQRNIVNAVSTIDRQAEQLERKPVRV